MTKITLVKDARDKEMLRLTDMLENAQSLMCAITSDRRRWSGERNH